MLPTYSLPPCNNCRGLPPHFSFLTVTLNTLLTLSHRYSHSPFSLSSHCFSDSCRFTHHDSHSQLFLHGFLSSRLLSLPSHQEG
jgi:hypothetical protein